jgi:hypothetical protein
MSLYPDPRQEFVPAPEAPPEQPEVFVHPHLRPDYDRVADMRARGIEVVITPPQPESAPKRRGGKLGSALMGIATGVGSLAGAASLAAYTQDQDATPTALYAEIATGYGLPGAEITDTLSERHEAETRRNLIEHSEARPITTFQTDSGITLEILQSGLDDNAARPILVDPEAANANLSFIIEGLDDVGQTAMSHEKIQEFQEKARRGELGNVTITVIASTDADHCLEIDPTTSFLELGMSECLDQDRAVGINWSASGGSGVETRSTINPTILVTPMYYELMVKRPQPHETTQEAVIAAETQEVVRVGPRKAMGSVLRHEFAHAVLSAMDSGLSMEQQHELLIHPLTYAGDTVMLGRVPGQHLDPALNFPL